MNLHDTRADLIEFANLLPVTPCGTSRGYNVGRAAGVTVRSAEDRRTFTAPGVVVRHSGEDPITISVDVITWRGHTITATAMAIGSTTIAYAARHFRGGLRPYSERRTEQTAIRALRTAQQRLAQAALWYDAPRPTELT